MEIVLAIIAGLGGIIGSVWGIVKYYDQKRERRESNISKEKQAQTEAIHKMSEKLDALCAKMMQQENDSSKLHQQLAIVESTLQTVIKKLDENETDRLRTDIIDCVGKIRNGWDITQVELDHVHHAYDKYVNELKGNSYVVNCMEFINDFENDCRKAGIEFD